MKIEVTAPGKTILHGEHAVVYGKAAVATSLSLKTTVSLVSHEEENVVLNLVNLGLKKEFDINKLNTFLCSNAGGDIIFANEDTIKIIYSSFEFNFEKENEKLAVLTFLFLWIHISKSYNAGTFPPCIVTVDSDLSIGAGMGSSASYAVCLSTAILIVCGRITPRLLPEDKELINKWALEAEKIFHGKPSGIDNSICTYGGALLFENGTVVDNLTEMHNINILLVDTRISRNTKDLVAGVKKRYELYSAVFDPAMEAIHAISYECWKLLKGFPDNCQSDEQMKPLEDLVNMNHHLLNCIGVGHPKLDQIYDISKKYHCVSKLTGAGGGGCAIILLPFKGDDKSSVTEQLKKELESCNFAVWDIFLGSSGVQVEFQSA